MLPIDLNALDEQQAVAAAVAIATRHTLRRAGWRVRIRVVTGRKPDQRAAAFFADALDVGVDLSFVGDPAAAQDWSEAVERVRHPLGGETVRRLRVVP